VAFAGESPRRSDPTAMTAMLSPPGARGMGCCGCVLSRRATAAKTRRGRVVFAAVIRLLSMPAVCIGSLVPGTVLRWRRDLVA
jgi:hypothetical protein